MRKQGGSNSTRGWNKAPPLQTTLVTPKAKHGVDEFHRQAMGLGEAGDDRRSTRSIFVTWNNYTDKEVELMTSWEAVKYYVIGFETAKTGTKHLHALLEFKNSAKVGTIRHRLHGAHLEVPRFKENVIKYCKKDGTFIETDTGVPENNQGKRNDLVKCCETIKKFGERAVYDDMPHMMLKYPNGIQKLLTLRAQDIVKPEPYICWIYGPPGYGKSFYVTDLCRQKRIELWTANLTDEWFDGYEPEEHKAVLIDDLRPTSAVTKGWSFQMLLRLLDRYDMNVPVKGGFKRWVPEYIFITAPSHPFEIYGHSGGESYDQLSRRLDEVLEFYDRGLAFITDKNKRQPRTYEKVIKVNLPSVSKKRCNLRDYEPPVVEAPLSPDTVDILATAAQNEINLADDDDDFEDDESSTTAKSSVPLGESSRQTVERELRERDFRSPDLAVVSHFMLPPPTRQERTSVKKRGILDWDENHGDDGFHGLEGEDAENRRQERGDDWV